MWRRCSGNALKKVWSINQKEKNKMKSWKTTLFGALAAVGAYLQTVQDPAWLQTVGKALVVAGPLLLGLFAKDSNVTGGTVQQ